MLDVWLWWLFRSMIFFFFKSLLLINIWKETNNMVYGLNLNRFFFLLKSCFFPLEMNFLNFKSKIQMDKYEVAHVNIHTQIQRVLRVAHTLTHTSSNRISFRVSILIKSVQCNTHVQFSFAFNENMYMCSINNLFFYFSVHFHCNMIE